VFAFGYEHLGDGAGESSIVERKGFWSGGVAIFYQF
jgi:outer membrane scaffolding protein for murein synthesis (MipA/OmpV family)